MNYDVTVGIKMLILGTGGHARAVADVAESCGFQVEGFVEPDTTLDGNHGFSSLDCLSNFDLNETDLCLGIGFNFFREKVFREIRSSFPNARFPVLVHNSANVSKGSKLSEGTVIMAMASVGPNCIIGRGSILNTGSSLDHDSRMGDFSSLAPGARTGGSVELGERSFLGLNAGMRQKATLGRDTVIGAQSLVTESLGDGVLAFGVPARTVRKRSAHEPYL